MQEWYLGWEKLSRLEKCPQFMSVLIEGFHYVTIYNVTLHNNSCVKSVQIQCLLCYFSH